MPGDIPNRTTSGTRAGDAFNRSRESLRSHAPVVSPGVLTSHTVHGVMREAEQPPASYGAEEAATPSTIKAYVIQSFKPNYMECVGFNGITPGTTIVLVAKLTKLRNNITSENGVNFSYDTTTLFRNANVPTTFGFSVENQVIVPRYRVGDIIYAADVDYTGIAAIDTTTQITKVDINVDGRVWSQITA